MFKDMVAREHGIIDQELSGIAGSLFFVTKWVQCLTVIVIDSLRRCIPTQ